MVTSLATISLSLCLNFEYMCSLIKFCCCLAIIFLSLGAQGQVIISASIIELRDSLDAVHYDIPSVYHARNRSFVIKVKSQKDWDNIIPTLKESLDAGKQNIVVKVCGKGIVYGKDDKVVQGWKYPHASIRFIGKKAQLIPNGSTYYYSNTNKQEAGVFYSFPYTDFGLNDIVLDSKGNEIYLREDVKQVTGNILKVQGEKNDIWKFQIDLPDLSEEQCKDFYVLMTRDWTSARHKVVMVKGGWLFYHLDSEDLHSDRNPNVDWTQYRVRPRYRLINSPVSEGVHFVNGRVYIPKHYKSIRINKSGRLITFAHCQFKSLEITGFKLNGCGGQSVFGIYSCIFTNGAYIHNNIFTCLSSMAVSTAYNENVMIANNVISNTREQAIAGGGKNTIICGNKLKNIGWMLNTRAITGGGERLHICDNVIEDFNYAAIACGSTIPNKESTILTFIIEHNTIRLTKEYTDNYIKNTLADGGGIYIGPQCTQGIIRNNVIENIKGINSNRGIFLDDGAKNLSIYGNFINNTANSYDIDLRYCTTYSAGIPDHNTKNIIIQNIMTGTYRFEDDDNHTCITGENVLLGNLNKVSVLHRKDDLKSVRSVKIDSFVKRHM